MAPSYILAVMGVTGAGKSSFIKLVTGDASVKVGHSQESETKNISTHVVYIRGRRFTLVDTPGFDDLHLKDSDVLKMLVNWLADQYRSGQKLSGILYLHRMTDTRMRGSSLRNLNMFKELIGDEFHNNVTLGMSCWSLVSLSVALEREAELKTSTTFWNTLLSKGARIERIPDNVTQTRELVYEIASHDALALQTQREIVDLGKSFSSLAVAQTVDYELEQVRKQQEAEVRRLREEARMRAEREEQALAEARERIKEKHNRTLEYQRNTIYCRRTKPSGYCDKVGCYNKLQRYQVTWHCCSCRQNDNHWHCGPCGNDCGNEEHPAMSRIDNDDCVLM